MRKLVFALLGLLAILALAVLLWAPLIATLPGGRFEFLAGAPHVRLVAGAAFVILLVLRAFLRPPRAPSKQAVAWGEFATSVGGTLTEERRGFGVLGWTGGTTVKWSASGLPVTLWTTRDTDRNWDTHITCEASLARPFQLHVTHQSMATKAMFSSALWSLALRAARARERESGIASPATGKGITDQLAFLAGKEVLVGDPLLDQALLIKSDSPDTAREFVVDAGVAHALLDLDHAVKGWQLSLMMHGPSEHQLALVVPGLRLDARELEACRALIEASARCLRDRGMTRSTRTRAA